MESGKSSDSQLKTSRCLGQWKTVFPLWASTYRFEYLSGDVLAGIIVAIVLVPQSMALAQLAGLPPEVGIYASILPPVVYSLIGSSSTLSVGPVAVISLITVRGIGELAEKGGSEYLTLALTLAFLVGAIQILMGLLRLEFLVNFISHSVMSGFVSAAALLTCINQIKHIVGISIPGVEYPLENVFWLIKGIGEINPVTLILGAGFIIFLLLYSKLILRFEKFLKLPESLHQFVIRGSPLLLMVIACLVVRAFRLDLQNEVKIVGAVPGSLPSFSFPEFDRSAIFRLMPAAFAISIVGFTESIAMSKNLAVKTRQPIRANRELFALGMANLSAALTSGYPVTGGMSRSVVNADAGAKTGLASIVCSAFVIISLLFLMPLIYYLPQAALASLIIVAVAKLIDIQTLVKSWRFSKIEAFSLVVTFTAVLIVDTEWGLIIGIGISIFIYLWRTSRPHIAIIGQIEGTDQFRNINRHKTKTWPGLLILRIDESLYFANSVYVESYIIQKVSEQKNIKAIILECSAVNDVDLSALELLENLIRRLGENNIQFYFSNVKGPVMDKLKQAEFDQMVGINCFYRSTAEAIRKSGFSKEKVAH